MRYDLIAECSALAADVRHAADLERELFMVRARIESRALIVEGLTRTAERVKEVGMADTSTPLADAVTREHPRLVEPGRYY